MSAQPTDLYESYEGFLKAAVREYYARGWKNNKANFIALLFASGQSLRMLGDTVKDTQALKKAAIGAVSVVALRYLLKMFVGGPLGLLLSAAAVASLVAYLARNRGEGQAKTERYKDLIAEHRSKYEEVQAGWRDGKFGENERNLMVDGMLKRFLDEVEAR